MQGAVLVVGRALQLNMSHLFVYQLLFEFLDEPGFADPRLTTQQDNLASPAFGEGPALVQQLQLFSAAYQRRQSAPHRCLKTTLRATLPDNAIHRNWSGKTF